MYRQIFWATLVDVTGISSVFLLSFGIIGVQVANKCVRRGERGVLEASRWGSVFAYHSCINTVGALGHLEFYGWFFASTIVQGFRCVHVCTV